MVNYDNLYCKIFVDTDKDREFVSNTISGIMSGVKKGFIVTTNNFEIEVRKNEDFDKEKTLDEDDGFLYSQYYLDIEPNEDVELEKYIRNIAFLLDGLWKLGWRAIASCDFEEELPRKGGYKYEG